MTVFRNLNSTYHTSGAVFSNAFFPKELPNNVLLFRSDLGITLVVSNVSQWNDYSGQGSNATQGTDANRPVYTASGGANSQAYLTWDGANTYLSLSPSIASGSFTFCCMVDPASTTGNQAIFGSLNAGANDLVLAQSTFDVNGSVGWYDNVAWYHAASGTTGAQILTFNLQTGTNNGVIYRNAAALGSAGTFHAEPIGTTVRLGANFNNALNFNGKIYEMILYTGTLSATNLRRLHRYMSVRYNIAIS